MIQIIFKNILKLLNYKNYIFMNYELFIYLLHIKRYVINILRITFYSL